MSITTEYWKSTLEGFSECRFYEQMRDGFSHGQTQITAKLLKAERISQIYNGFMNDHPELFMLPHGISLRETFSFGIVSNPFTVLTAEPIYSDSDVKRYRRDIERVCAELEKRAVGLSVREREKLICDWMIEHVVYGIDPKYNQDASSAIARGKAQCSGISRAVKLLCDRLDIKCAVVSGTAANERGETDSHAWNIVWIDGAPCHLDVTYMMGANMSKTKPYRYMYLNYSDGEMRANHGWDESSVPRCSGDGRAHGAVGTVYGGAARQNAGAAAGDRQSVQSPISAAARALGVSESEIKDVIAPYELKYMLKSAIKNGKPYLCVNCKISADPKRLTEMLNGAVKQALAELRLAASVSVSQCGTLYKYAWR